MITTKTCAARCKWGLIFLAWASLFVRPMSALAIETTPNPINGGVRQEWRGPIGKLLTSMGAANVEDVLARTTAFALQKPVGEGEIFFQVQADGFCPKGADGCLSSVGRIVGTEFVPDILFLAGTRMNSSDAVPNVFAAKTHSLRFYGSTTIVLLFKTPGGWMVAPAKQTEPPT